MATTILLADDHQILREGLRSLLTKVPGMEVVAEAETGRDAVAMARKLAPDVAILDISMPDMNGVEAARQIAARCPKTRIIALSIHRDRRFASEMLKAGARGYCLKDAPFAELAEAIRAAMDGHSFLSPAVMDVVIGDYMAGGPEARRATEADLTSREREVLQLLAEGHSAKTIASRLHVSPSTVDTHRQHIMGKLGLRSIAELTKYAVREGLTSLED